ncbi:SWF or SNF family helicase [Streptomyces sp. NBC_01775]|nr:SWF or SNF family helicase [Streptomyces sp. NBC_01775]WSB74684.1 SWF or SNF family helicase [Streptomyces sp. NBC_01775]
MSDDDWMLAENRDARMPKTHEEEYDEREEREDSTEQAGVAAREKVFAPLPPAQGRGFARTWWGQTWLKALEDTALDGAQLKQGRKYARQGAVGAVSVRPGRITAVVLGADRTPYRADVLLRELEEEEWDRMLDMIVDEAGHIAALLDRDMPPRLVEDAAEVGLELLPGIGDLDPECACGAWDHCPHSAALSYQMARLLDEDPFALLLMRGRGERELLDALQERSAARAAPEPHSSSSAPDGTEEEAGVDAAEAFALGTLLPPLPGPPPLVREPGEIAALDVGTSAAPGVDIDALTFLASDAAARARRTLTEAESPGHGSRPVPRPLSAWEDAVRLASGHPGRAVTARLAQGSGRSERELGAAVRAWEFGGQEALAVLDETWSPSSADLERAAARLDAAWADGEERPRLRAAGARWTAVGAHAQLRYGPDGLWWPFRKEGRSWWPAGAPERDPAAALAVALAGDEEPAEVR